MSGRGRQIKIEILGDAKDAQKAFDSLEKSSTSLGSNLKNVASIAGGFILAQGLMKLPGLFTSAVDAGSNLEESLNAVNQIFGDSAQAILDWGENNANAFGLSQRAFNDLAVPLGAGLKNAGLDMGDVTDHTIALTERAADMASVFNTDVDDALAAIQAGLRGQGDPLEQYGVGLTAARVEAEALAMTSKSVASELTEEEKALARVSLIMSQTEDVAGDFANTSDGVANSARIAAARQEELAATIGTQLLPIQQALTQAKLEFLELLANRVIPAVISFSDILKDRLRPMLKDAREAFDTVRDGVRTFAQALEGDWTDAEGIRGVHRWIGRLGTLIHDDIMPVVDDFIEGFEDLIELFDDMPTSIGEIEDALDDISFDDITSGLSGVGSRIVGAISNSLDTVDWSGVRGKIAGGLSVGFSFTTDKAQEIVDSISTAFDNVDWADVRGKVRDGLLGGIAAAEGTGQRAVDGISTQLDEVDWTSIQGKIRDGVLGGLSAGGEEASNAGEQIQTWLTSEVEALEDWETLGRAVKGGILSGLAVASGGAALALGITDWIAGEITEGEGDWSTIANNIAEKVGEAFGEAVSIGDDLVGWIKKSLGEVEWQATADAVALGIAGALANVQGIAQGIADSIAGHIGKVDWSGTDWEAATDGMTLNLGTSLQSSFTNAFGEVDLESVVRDSGLVLTPELLFGDGGLMDTLGDVKDEIGDIARVLEEELGPTLEDAREAWEEWQPILEPIVGLIADLQLGALIILIESLLLPLKLAAESLQIFFEATQTALGGIEFLGEQIHAFAEGIGVITGWSETATGAIVGWSETSVEKAGEFLDGMLGPIDEMALSGGETISGFVTDSVGKLGEFVTDAAGKAEEIASGVVDGLKNLISIDASVGGVGQFVKFGLEAGKKVAGIATEAVGWAADIAWAFIQGLIDNMTSFEALNSVFNAAKDLGQSMLDGAKGILRIDSPSKEGYAIGEWFYRGMIEGLGSGEQEVYEWGWSLGESAAEGAQDGWEESWEGYSWEDSFWNQGQGQGSGGGGSTPPSGGSVAPPTETDTAADTDDTPASGGSGATQPVSGFGQGSASMFTGSGTKTGPEFRFVHCVGEPPNQVCTTYRIRDNAEPSVLLDFMEFAHNLGQKVYYDGGTYGPGPAAKSAGAWAQKIINKVSDMQSTSEAMDLADTTDLVSGPTLLSTTGGFTGGSSSSTQSQSSPAGTSSPTIVQNFTLRRADPDEIANESMQAMRFAALDPSLVGNLP